MQVFLIQQRNDIPDGTLQVVDLWPNTSNKNSIYPPGLGQTGYLHSVTGPIAVTAVTAGPPVVANATLEGMAAYLLGNVDTGAGAGGAVFTAVQANTAAALIVTAAQTNADLTLADVNAILGGVVAGTTLTAGGSTGVLTELLSVLAGNRYEIAAGTEISDGGGNFAGRVGGFVAGTYKQLYDTGYFNVSAATGNVSLLKAATFTYEGTAGAAVAVYDELGNYVP